MSQLTISASGAIKLSQDLSNLVNNPIGSDIRIEVGGGENTLASTSSEKSQKATSSDEKTPKLATATFHAHSAILRFRSKYFSTLYENEWSETTSGVFRKPNISPIVFHSLLYYMYTGNVEISNVSLLPEVIAAAEEMELEELSLICQSRLINELKHAAENSNDDDPKTTNNQDENSENISFSLTVRTLLIPALIFAYQHILGEFFDELVDFTVDNIKAIIDTKNAFSAFIEKIPVAVFKQILSADSLDLEEYDVWQLALSWGCHRVELLKSIVEAQVRLNANAENYGDDEDAETSSSSNLKEHAEKANKPLVPDDQLLDLKLELRSLLPTIRFTLMEPDQYLKTVPVFNFFLPSRRLLELQRFFSKPGTPSQEVPRGESSRSNGIPGSRIAKYASEELKNWIYSTNAISGCSSMKDLKFKFLYRASTHGFQAATFHNKCDNKGPTLVLVRSSDNHLFGGVNFTKWTSNGNHSNSGNNFLFALKDGKHRTQSVKFPYSNANYAASNNPSYGPMFGGGDLYISDNSNASQSSTSDMPQYYNGSGASNTTLAGAQSFMVADYEVFAISKK